MILPQYMIRFEREGLSLEYRIIPVWLVTPTISLAEISSAKCPTPSQRRSYFVIPPPQSSGGSHHTSLKSRIRQDSDPIQHMALIKMAAKYSSGKKMCEQERQRRSYRSRRRGRISVQKSAQPPENFAPGACSRPTPEAAKKNFSTA